MAEQTTTSSPENMPPPAAPEPTSERELSHRTEYTQRGEASLKSADVAMAAKDYEKATAFFKMACDIIPNAALTKSLYDRAISGFCDASCKQAGQRIAEGRYADAENILRIVTDERYNPRCKEAVLILSHLEDPTFYNRAVGPEFRSNIEKVKQLLVEAQGFCDTGRFDFAF